MMLTRKDDDINTNLRNSNPNSVNKHSKKVLANIRIATINIRTLQDELKLATTVKAAQNLGFDVLALQEVRHLSTGVITFDDESLKGWQFVWSGHKKKRQHGVGILLAPHVQLVSYKEHLQARIISATVSVRGMRLAILNVYAPTDASDSESAKNIFYASLNKAKIYLDNTPKYKVIPLGDFNATISSTSKNTGSWNEVLGSNNSDRVDTNDNGERMLTWCLRNKMRIINSFFRTKRIHRGTWRNPATGKWKRIDYICASAWISQFVTSCRAYAAPSRLFDTDHRVVVMNITFPTTKKALRKNLNTWTVREPKPITNVQALRDNRDLRDTLTARLDDDLVNLECLDINDLNEKIATSVRSSTEDVCPKVDQVKKKEPWDDAELIQKLKDLRKKSRHEDVRKMQKEINKRRNDLKNAYYQELANGINNAANAREVEKEFALAKKYNAIKVGTRKTISNEKLKAHFEQHFAERDPPLPLPPELAEPENFPYLLDEQVEINQEAPNEEETREVLRTFKNNKSGGTDQLKTEGLKYNSSQRLVDAIVLLLTLIWTLIVIPTMWLHASINCLYKKGPMDEAKNYRGISIGANMSRILAKLITNRFKHAYETNISEAQFGFRQNRSTADGMFIVKTVVEKYGGMLVATYIDLTAAYDHVPRDFLFRILQIRTGASHLVAILRKMYEGTTAVIRGMDVKFDVLVGCRQGGQESPVLFNLYFDYVLKIVAQEVDAAFPNGWGIDFNYIIPHLCTNRKQRKHGKMSGVEIVQWILYADDVVLFSKTPQEAEKILTIMDDTCKRFGLSISFSKTKTQVFNNNELADKPTIITVNGNEIENVKDFIYLGQLFTTDENACFTDHRISRAIAKFNELRKVLCDTNINLRTRRKFMEACVRTRLTYGVEAYFPKERQLVRLEACWNQLLRSMVKGGWKRVNSSDDTDENDYRFVYSNADIQRILRTTNLRNFIHEKYIRYVGHVCRLPNTAIAKKLLFACPSRRYYRNPWLKIAELLGVDEDQAKRVTQNRKEFHGFVSTRFKPTRR